MSEASSELRDRIVKAAARLLVEGGREAVSTRAVSSTAKVQAPAIYRQFGDMQNLLLAAARTVLAGYVREKTRAAPTADPVEELRHGWDLHVAFGLANPAAYALLYADPALSDGVEAREGFAHLTALVTRVAKAGRLQVSIPLAVKMIHAGGSGVTLTLITTPPNARDLKLSSAMRDAVLDAILVTKKEKSVDGRDRVASRAVGLRAVLGEAKDVLSSAETKLMEEWLDRMADVGEPIAEPKSTVSARPLRTKRSPGRARKNRSG